MGQHTGLSAGLTMLRQVPPLTREEGHREPAAGLVGTARGPVLARGCALEQSVQRCGKGPCGRRPPPISGQADFGAPSPSLPPAVLIFTKPSNLSFLPEIGCEDLTPVRAGVDGPPPPAPHPHPALCKHHQASHNAFGDPQNYTCTSYSPPALLSFFSQSPVFGAALESCRRPGSVRGRRRRRWPGAPSCRPTFRQRLARSWQLSWKSGCQSGDQWLAVGYETHDLACVFSME